jgi:hypothetical protein
MPTTIDLTTRLETQAGAMKLLAAFTNVFGKPETAYQYREIAATMREAADEIHRLRARIDDLKSGEEPLGW